MRATSSVTLLKVGATLLEQASANCQLRFNRVFLRGLIERLQKSDAEAAAPAESKPAARPAKGGSAVRAEPPGATRTAPSVVRTSPSAHRSTQTSKTKT